MTAAVDAAVMSHEKTDWQKNHARDRSYFAQYCHAMSDRKSQLITICMLIGALAMIGLALTGTFQMRASHTPVTILTR
jgi:hypothetical protein